MNRPPPDMPEDFSSETPSPRRPIAGTVKRRLLPLLTLFCLICSAVFLAATLLQRSYSANGSMQVTSSSAALPDVNRFLENARKQPPKEGVEITTVKSGGDGSIAVNLFGVAKSRELAVKQMREASQIIAFELNRVAVKTGAGLRAAQEKKSAELAMRMAELPKKEADFARREQELSLAIEQFKLTNHAALPDDPYSTVTQFEKLVEKMDGRQQRLQIITQQISRLRDYKKANDADGGRGALPPPPIPAGEGTAPPPPAAPANPENDPEVLALTAQVQLINKQIDEQLTTMGRTEQHPYVVDLRKQQADLQKKLAAAKDRAAAGKPAPADSLPADSDTRPANSSLTAVDINLQNLQAEHDALDTEMKTLTAQREVLQEKVKEVPPIRQKLGTMTANLAAIQQDRQAIHKQTDELAAQLAALPDHSETAIVKVAPLTVASSSTLPTFPSLPAIYGVGVAIGVLASIVLALFLHKADRSLHTPAEAAQVFEVPILGTVSEIRSPKMRRRHHLWRTAGQPAVILALLAITLCAAILSYQRLAASPPADPGSLHSAASLTSINPPASIQE